jgi:dihydrofolate reductase
MRRIRYQVACSLDGFIAGPAGQFDWIPADPDIDFTALFAQFDTLLMGRRTFEAAGGQTFPGMDVIVVSQTLDPRDHPGRTIIPAVTPYFIAELRTRPGRDIWLYGGGELFRSMLELGVVDTVEPAIVPILLGRGVPLLPETDARVRLTLTDHTIYPKSGIALLRYNVAHEREMVRSEAAAE